MPPGFCPPFLFKAQLLPGHSLVEPSIIPQYLQANICQSGPPRHVLLPATAPVSKTPLKLNCVPPKSPNMEVTSPPRNLFSASQLPNLHPQLSLLPSESLPRPPRTGTSVSLSPPGTDYEEGWRPRSRGHTRNISRTSLVVQ